MHPLQVFAGNATYAFVGPPERLKVEPTELTVKSSETVGLDNITVSTVDKYGNKLLSYDIDVYNVDALFTSKTANLTVQVVLWKARGRTVPVLQGSSSVHTHHQSFFREAQSLCPKVFTATSNFSFSLRMLSVTFFTSLCSLVHLDSVKFLWE